MEKREWFYPAADGTETVGPLTSEQVGDKLRTGELRVDDYIWGTHFSDQNWRRIFELEELRPYLPVRAAPPPTAPPFIIRKPDAAAPAAPKSEAAPLPPPEALP